MGLREKVALIITVIILIQVIFILSSLKKETVTDNKDDINEENQQEEREKRSVTTATSPFTLKNRYPFKPELKNKRKTPSESSEELLRRAFHFPSVEYPTASTPRLHYYLQEANILQRNQIPRTSDLFTSSKPSSIISTNDDTKNYVHNNKKYKNFAKLKSNKKPGITTKVPELSSSYKPYYKEGLFPEVEYPLSAWETWKPKYWQQMSSYGQNNIDIDNKLKSSVDTTRKKNCGFSKKKSVASIATPQSTSLKKSNNSTTKSPTNVPVKNENPKEDTCINASPSNGITYPSQGELIPITNDQDNLISVVPDVSLYNLGTLDTCPNIGNKTNAATSLSYVNKDDTLSIIPFKICKDDKMSTVCGDNSIESKYDVINTVVSENTDNKDLCFDDNVRNNNTLPVFDVDEEFTTDVFPDFDENIISVSTSTMSPMTLDIDEGWANVVVLDPYKSIAYPDELEQCYIALP